MNLVVVRGFIFYIAHNQLFNFKLTQYWSVKDTTHPASPCLEKVITYIILCLICLSDFKLINIHIFIMSINNFLLDAIFFVGYSLKQKNYLE